MSNLILRETLRVLRAAGFEPHIEQSRHIKLRIVDATGRTHLFVISRSPSDRRACHSHRALLRRFLRKQQGNDHTQEITPGGVS
jgi:hypothetical protein